MSNPRTMSDAEKAELANGAEIAEVIQDLKDAFDRDEGDISVANTDDVGQDDEPIVGDSDFNMAG